MIVLEDGETRRGYVGERRASEQTLDRSTFADMAERRVAVVYTRIACMN